MTSKCSYSFEHTPLIDAASGTLVCCSCGTVLTNDLTYEETRFSLPGLNKPKPLSPDLVNGENVLELLEKICDQLNLSQSTIDKIHEKFSKVKDEIENIIYSKEEKAFKRKRSLLSKTNILVYSIYVTLKQDQCPRPLKEVCFFSKCAYPNDVIQIEKFLEKNSKSELSQTRFQPVTARDIILTHYPYIDNFSFEDVKQIFHKLNCIQPTNFSSSTSAAGIVYLYLNHAKNIKTSKLKVSTLFNVTPMSIQRFSKKYKNYF